MGHVTGLLKENGKGAGFRTEPFFSSLLNIARLSGGEFRAVLTASPLVIHELK